MALRKKLESWVAPRNAASMRWRDVLFGGGVFDVSGDHPNKKGWEIFELGQKSFWAVPTAIAWDEPIRENPEYAEPIAAMLTFLCPGEKAAVTGASYISNLVRSEEAKFYFAEQALEEAKHYDALRRVIPKITGRPLDPPNFWVRFLYSFGVVDRDDVAFMMGNIN
ncbi:MAG: ferritin-like domain-containing protein, partial [Polyangiaceae bacterium]